MGLEREREMNEWRWQIMRMLMIKREREREFVCCVVSSSLSLSHFAANNCLCPFFYYQHFLDHYFYLLKINNFFIQGIVYDHIQLEMDQDKCISVGKNLFFLGAGGLDGSISGLRWGKKRIYIVVIMI